MSMEAFFDLVTGDDNDNKQLFICIHVHMTINSVPVWWPTSLVEPEGHLPAACRPPGNMILLECIIGRRRMILLGFSLQLPLAALTISLPDAATS